MESERENERDSSRTEGNKERVGAVSWRTKFWAQLLQMATLPYKSFLYCPRFKIMATNEILRCEQNMNKEKYLQC